MGASSGLSTPYTVHVQTAGLTRCRSESNETVAQQSRSCQMRRMRTRVGRYLLIRGPGNGPRGHRFDILDAT